MAQSAGSAECVCSSESGGGDSPDGAGNHCFASDWVGHHALTGPAAAAVQLGQTSTAEVRFAPPPSQMEPAGKTSATEHSQPNAGSTTPGVGHS